MHCDSLSSRKIALRFPFVKDCIVIRSCKGFHCDPSCDNPLPFGDCIAIPFCRGFHCDSIRQRIALRFHFAKDSQLVATCRSPRQRNVRYLKNLSIGISLALCPSLSPLLSVSLALCLSSSLSLYHVLVSMFLSHVPSLSLSPFRCSSSAISQMFP